MSRTYLRAAGLTAVGLLAAGLSQEGSARALFDSAAVPQERFAVLELLLELLCFLTQ